MRYLKFRIRNFKGIKDTEIDLRSLTGTNVFPFVGLNESGKTTILEAIHSFSPDFRTKRLRQTQSKSEAAAAQERLPRHQIASFSGDITVEALVSIGPDEKREICEGLKGEAGVIVSPASIPDQFTLSRSDIFKRGDYVETRNEFDFDLIGRRKGERKDRPITGAEYKAAYLCFWNYAPDIAYHDSFIFEFPKRIYLTVRPGASDWVYRQMFEDVLATGRTPYELKDITRRISNETYKKGWLEFFNLWSQNDDRNKVQQIIDQASQTITEVVFGKWNKIFGEDVGGKEISVQFNVEKGRNYDKDTRTYSDSDSHDIYISLEIKDGTRRFPVQDRSLGFRWFFAFLLFTQFRTRRGSDRPVVFLFDEPAANLHSAAQERLIESFPEIATGDNMLLYSTHSHYMVSPDWLEQTFIITNSADAPDRSVVDSAIIEDESLDIKAQLYRSFTNEHPSETSYFQPIVDRLEIKPSSFDISIPSVIVEGKSDYYILRYSSIVHSFNLRLIPATGSGTFGALISLGAVWGTKFAFLLDNDNAGIKERARYALDHGAREEALCALSDFDAGLSEIESILDSEARSIIAKRLGVDNLSKKMISRFFQEQLAKRDSIELGKNFAALSLKLLEGLSAKLASL